MQRTDRDPEDWVPELLPAVQQIFVIFVIFVIFALLTSKIAQFREDFQAAILVSCSTSA